MRHRVAKKTLQRDKSHRVALLKNLSTSLIINEKVITTVSKAKYLRPHIEKLITKAKKGNGFNNVKYMKSKLFKEDAVRKILSDLGPRFSKRPGGYTRIIKIKNREGDNAPMARIEFVEKPRKKEKKVTEKVEKKSGRKITAKNVKKNKAKNKEAIK